MFDEAVEEALNSAKKTARDRAQAVCDGSVLGGGNIDKHCDNYQESAMVCNCTRKKIYSMRMGAGLYPETESLGLSEEGVVTGGFGPEVTWPADNF